MRQVPIVRAEPGMVLARDITNASGHLLLRRGTTLNSRYIDKLKQFGVMRLIIEDDRTDDIIVPPSLSQEMQLRALDTAQRILTDGRIPNKSVAERIETCVEEIVAELSASPALLVHLMDLYTREDAMFFHAVNTTVLSLTVAIALRANPQRLQNLGVVAMLHDIGLSRVPPEVLASGLSMSPEERKEYRQHPVYGAELLHDTPGVTSVAARGVLQHHEWLSGEGYPMGLREEQILDVAKVVSVADYYDSHVSPQWYRPSMLPHEAIKAMVDFCDRRFDRRIVEVFLRRVAVYPIGTGVKLGNGCVGIVARVHDGMPMRPVVRVVTEPDGTPTAQPYDLDLVQHPTIQIAAVVDL